MVRLILFSASAMALGLLVSCNELNPPKPRTQEVVWKAIGSWSGTGNSQTDSFDMTIMHWRVHWVAKNPTSDATKGTFVLNVNSAVSGRILQEAVRHEGPGEGYADVFEDPRLFHLVIEAKDLDWTVTAEVPIAVGGNQK